MSACRKPTPGTPESEAPASRRCPPPPRCTLLREQRAWRPRPQRRRAPASGRHARGETQHPRRRSSAPCPARAGDSARSAAALRRLPAQARRGGAATSGVGEPHGLRTSRIVSCAARRARSQPSATIERSSAGRPDTAARAGASPPARAASLDQRLLALEAADAGAAAAARRQSRTRRGVDLVQRHTGSARARRVSSSYHVG